MASAADQEGFMVVLEELNHFLYVRVPTQGKHFCFGVERLVPGSNLRALFDEFDRYVSASRDVLSKAQRLDMTQLSWFGDYHVLLVRALETLMLQESVIPALAFLF